jgi:hypothetical protein
MAAFLIVLAILIAAGLLLFRFNGAWIYSVWDRATRNSTDRIPPGFDLPRYYRKKENGELDLENRWPGWDGWYFFVLPDGNIPVQMLRGSLMTGLYGLDGIDNYERLKFRLSTFNAVEYLSLMPMFVKTPGGIEKRNNLSQHYVPRRWHLFMNPHALDISITGQQARRDEKFEEYGRISGKWPAYRFHFLNPEGDISADLNFTAEKVVWWADAPGLFTYFSVLGRFEGKLTLHSGSSKPDPHKIPAGEETYQIRGGGALEHGFARKLFGFDPVFLPVRLFNYIVPSFRPIRYHYETFISEGGERGGYMHARAFGVPVRDRGGFFLEGTYIPIDSVKITYFEDPAPDLAAAHCPDRPPVKFYRKWLVQAKTSGGVLEYTGIREFPPAPVASNMTYYHFAYTGTYQGRSLKGRGYGEYVHI